MVLRSLHLCIALPECQFHPCGLDKLGIKLLEGFTYVRNHSLPYFHPKILYNIDRHFFLVSAKNNSTEKMTEHVL